MALASRPEARAELAGVQQALSALPGGEFFAQRLAALRGAAIQELAALSTLVRDLDAKVRPRRDVASKLSGKRQLLAYVAPP